MKNSKSLVVVLLASTLLTFSCAKKATEETAASVATDGSQTAAGLAGSGMVCALLSGVGTNLNNKAYARVLTINADSTFSYSIYFSDATSCATAANTGGNNIATYTMSGTFALGGIANTPSTATKIAYTVTNVIMTIRPGSYTGGLASSLATYFNNFCGASFSTSANGTQTFSNLNCTADSANTYPSTPLVGASYANIAYAAGSNVFQAGVRGNIWSPGSLGTTYPTSYTETWGTWQ